MTPHVSRFPALPVFKDSSLLPLPKSSRSLCTIIILPRIQYLPGSIDNLGA